jgi:hypothetical protein
VSSNYYVHTGDGREIHLGKYVTGEPFHFRGYPDEVENYSAWLGLLELGEIRAEHGMVLTATEMDDLVLSARRRWGLPRRHRPYRDQVDDETGNRFTLVDFC